MDEREGRGQGEGPAGETRKAHGRAGVARIALVLGAALAVVAGLECAPSRSTSGKKLPEAPIITAEERPRFPRSPHANPRWSWPGMAQFQTMYDQAERQAKPIRLVYGRLAKDVDGQHVEVERSIKESGRAAPIAARLSAWAKDGAFDEYNRVTATQILALLEDDAALADEASLSEIARLWLAWHRAKK
ncbi:hypothetical protein [Polyangium jinanense]|uniref:Uncharacterized protein n=1 Tax=Polyangium jinanense TaxID=2829994 RepID=A0A9X3XC07_9BACT|nr:hypothetical protein [Polyangium jinanense]MDC3961338.1 hypothetical protein [Polyangium jinanense]MDC3987717.1 hypothetical protein [Polyangium jinanense]